MEESFEGGAAKRGVSVGASTVLAGTVFEVIIGHTEAKDRRHLEGLGTRAVTGGGVCDKGEVLAEGRREEE